MTRRIEDSAAPIPAAPDPSADDLSVGDPAAIAARLSILLGDGNVIYVADGEVRGAAIAAALAVAAPAATVAFCPGSDALPGDAAPASPANIGARVTALYRIRRAATMDDGPAIALVTTGEGCARLYPAPDAFDVAPPTVRTGDAIDLPALAAELEAIGYRSDDRVDEPGEIALRGRVIDVFPADMDQPARIEEEDGRIVRLCRVDPATERTTADIDTLELGHVAEPAIGPGVTLPAHLPGAALVIEPRADERRRRWLALAADISRRAPRRATRDTASEARWATETKRHPAPPPFAPTEPVPRFAEEDDPLDAFVAFAEPARAAGVVVLLGHPRDLRFLGGRIAHAMDRAPEPAADWRSVSGADAGSLLALPILAERGFRADGVVAIAAADLLGSRALRGDGVGSAGGDAAAFEFGNVSIGDVVVHEDHGIGVIDAVEPMPDGQCGDALAIRYADDARRLVPVTEADRIWRYGGDPDAVTLDRLDGGSWEKRRVQIDVAIAESARALTRFAAERADQEAPVLAPDAAAYERFVAGFPFAETPDQARAIAAVRRDLVSGTPMDRLVVGDVGFGKTEVALRAAAQAALAGWQVAVAAPTTVLARQHLDVFAARFAEAGIAVAGLSRLSSAAEKRAVKAGLADGSVRVVVGTAAIAVKALRYARLGLVIVDEEQRFGAADKARLRALGAGHLLTLSATPIPRTLQGALVGLRQLSVIATPPARRQPIRTAVTPFDPATLRAALLREHGRGGQSFAVVPRIEDMDAVAAMLAELVPELELVRAHGKMPAAEIDEAMVSFAHGSGDVLLATSIIEAGLDVPRANTMAIWRADRFGLSQLHQLRGRVGRGSRRGQVLLFTDDTHAISPRTLKRLRTLEAFDRLGAGFEISARDLDMRGAGDLLGEAQAGHMKLIGADLYQNLLASAIRAAHGEDVERWTPELNLELEGRLPDDWIAEPEVRVTLYGRLSRIADAAALEAFEDELEDRFGTLPPAARTLIAVARVRLNARRGRIARIDAGPAAIAFTPRRDFAGNAGAAGLHDSKGRLLLAEQVEDPGDRLAVVERTLAALRPRRRR